MRKRILLALTGIFFLLMLLGTFFHEKVDALFRVQVRAVAVQKETVQVPAEVTVNGEEIQVQMTEEFLTVPGSAVRENRVYVTGREEVAYGSYSIVWIWEVRTDGEWEGRVKIAAGLSEGEEIVEVFTDTLSDGMRVRVIR